MKLHTFLFVPSLVALAAFLGACGGSAVSSAEGKEPSCREFCAQQASCSELIDASSCESSCNDTTAVSRGGQEVLTKCVAETGCDQSNLLSLVDCIDDGLDDLPRSPTATSFCEETSPALAELCEQETSDPAACLEGIPLLSDELLTDMQECAERTTCQSAQQCVVLALLGNVDTALLSNPTIQGALGGSGLGGLLGSGLGGMTPGGTPPAEEMTPDEEATPPGGTTTPGGSTPPSGGTGGSAN